MGFESITLSQERRKAAGLTCNTSTCGCDTCPVKAFCKGPSSTCDAKFCSTRLKDSIGCIGCRAVCNKNPDRATLIKSLGGAGFDDVTWNSFDETFPDVMFQINSLVYNRPDDFYIINSKKLTYLDTLNWSPQKNLYHRFKLSPKGKTILSFFTNDAWMDNYAADLKDLSKEIKKFNPTYVFGPDFSVYENYPRFDIIVNLRRRILSIKYFQDQGLKVIPTLGWIREEDLDRMIEWALKNKIKYALINLQTIALPVHNPAWQKKLNDLKRIRKELPDCEILIVGSTAENRLKSIMENIGKVKLIDTRCYRLAEYHKDLNEVKYDKSKSVLDLFDLNKKLLKEQYNKILGEIQNG